MDTQLWQHSDDAHHFIKEEKDLLFQVSGVPLNHSRNNDGQREQLRSLLKELLHKAEAQGVLFFFRKLTHRKSIRVGHIQCNVQLTSSDKRLLKLGKAFIKDGFYVQPVQNKQRVAGIICINCDDENWSQLCEDLVHLYALLIAQKIEAGHKKKIQLEQAQTLQNKKRELEDLQQYNQNLLSMAAHDLSSPLNAVSGYLEMIEDCLANDKNKQKLQQYYRRIQSGVNDVADILKQLNEIIQFKEGRLTLHRVQVDVNWIVRDVCDLLKAVANKKNIELRVSSGSLPAYVEVDIIKFKRVIYNLVSNAIKYTDKNRSIDVGISSHNGRVEVHVKDEGEGISEEEMDTIFQPFVKLGASDNDLFSQGLGLHISSYFMELMGGIIEAKSKAGYGSTFVAAIPEVRSPVLQNKTA